MRYYTSDLHFGHQLVAETRGFVDDPDEDWVAIADHDNTVLSSLLNLNPRGDQLWILGDLSSGGKRMTERALNLLAGVPVPKHLILGNHDPAHPMHRDAWKWQRRYLDVFESIQPFARHRFTVNGERHDGLLSHFPYQDGGDHTEYERYPQYRLPDLGRWLLHGHTHSHERVQGRQIHVGWDTWRRPVSEDEIVDLIRAEGAS